MTTNAPPSRIVNALTGEIAHPTKFFRALSEADNFIRTCDGQTTELDRLRNENAGLRCRIDELTEGGSLEQQVRELGAEVLLLRSKLDRVTAERDTYRAALAVSAVKS